jgi:hypothetical protein
LARTTPLLLLLLLAAAKEEPPGLVLTIEAPWAAEVRLWRIEHRGEWHRRVPLDGKPKVVAIPAGAEYIVTVENRARGFRADDILTGLVTAGQRVTVRPKPQRLRKLVLSTGPGILRVDSGAGGFSGYTGHEALAGPDGPPRVLDSCVPKDGISVQVALKAGETRTVRLR